MENKLLSFLTTAVEKGWLPGFSSVFIANGKQDIVIKGNKATYPETESLTSASIYDIASLTKVLVTTTLVLQLVEEKKLELSGKVKDYLPEFNDTEVTLSDLLTHCSGLPADTVLDLNWSIETYRDQLYKTPLSEKGKVQYSDIGFILLGWIIETVTGEALSQLSTERIVHPLALKDTGYNLERPTERFVPTEKRADTGLKRGQAHDRKAAYLGGVSGHAGWFTTIEDSAVLLKSLLNGSSPVFPASYKQWMSEYAGNGRTLGWEWRKSVKGDNYLYHTGFTGVFIFVNVTKKRGGVVLTNSIHPKRDNPYKEKRNQLIEQLFTEGWL